MKGLVAAVIAFSLVAIAALFWLIYGVELSGESEQMAFLPAFNASMNALSASALTIGLFHIRARRLRAHGISMLVALTASALFLGGYILHHSLHGDTRFLTGGWLRPLYFFILISHILLSIVALPLILTTFLFAALRAWDRHRAIAKWTAPIWLYVSVTGVLVFAFLRFLNTVPQG
jgi:putative membrane protein